MAYDPDNIFAKILRGEAPAFKVYEDDKTLAFMDIMPRLKAIPSSSPRRVRNPSSI